MNIIRIDNGDNKFFMHFRAVFSYDILALEIEEEAKEAAKTFKLQGFRDGKVPLSLVKRQIKPELTQRLLRNKIDEIVSSIIDEHKISVMGAPSITVTSIDEAADISFEVKMSLMPKIPVMNISELNLVHYSADIDDETIERAKKQLLNESKRFITDVTENYEAEKGDKVTADLEVTQDGKAAQSSKNLTIILGSERLPSEVEEQLIGVKAGDHKVIEYLKPDSDKKVVSIFGFDVKAVAKVNPEDVDLQITDEMTKRYGLSSVTDLEEQIGQKISSELGIVSRMRLKRDMIEKIADLYDFEIPGDLLKQATTEVISEINKGEKNTEQIDSNAKEIASKRVKVGLIFAEIAKLNSIRVTKDDIDMAIDIQKKNDPQNADRFEKFISSTENLTKLETQIFEEKIVDFILSRANVETVNVKASELLNM